MSRTPKAPLPDFQPQDAAQLDRPQAVRLVTLGRDLQRAGAGLGIARIVDGASVALAQPPEGFSQHLPPGPWTWTENAPKWASRPGHGFVYIHDATGRKIGTVWGTPAEKVAIADLICAASSMAAAE